MNVFIFSGSNNPSNSNCGYIGTMLSRQLNQLGISTNLYLAYSLNLKYCEGCLGCFMGGRCQIDDDFSQINSALFQSDAIVLISPVYAHAISAVMKSLIDRCAYMMHLMPLAGKIGINVSVSNDNGNKFVNEYLDKVVQYWGVTVVDSIAIQSLYMDIQIQDSYIQYMVEQLSAYDEGKPIIASPFQEQVFQLYKSKHADSLGSPEAAKWIQQGYDKKSTFQEVIDSYLYSKQ